MNIAPPTNPPTLPSPTPHLLQLRHLLAPLLDALQGGDALLELGMLGPHPLVGLTDLQERGANLNKIDVKMERERRN